MHTEIRGARLGDEKGTDVKQELLDAVVDTRTVPAEPDGEITAWLGEDFVDWTPGNLVVRNGDDTAVLVLTGWVLCRWPDGWLGVSSASFARRTMRPLADG